MRRVGGSARRTAMKRFWKEAAWRGIAAVMAAVVVAGCGGGGGGGGGGAGVPTPTPTLGRNSRTETNANGSTTLQIDTLELLGGDTTAFMVVLRDTSGAPLVGEPVRIATGAGLVV